MGVVPRTDNKYYGVVKYDKVGKPVCHICGRSFNALLRHVRSVHSVMPEDYKKMFGLSPKKGILSKRTREKMQALAAETAEVKKASLAKGRPFKRGGEGNPSERWSVEGRRSVAEANRNRKQSSL
ncbi:MucR family transcriptional regulator [Paenibacillus xylanexedens]|uniref:MucR family transcriptional regulator n=1 Tax=Paenibacillus xylanexedens TaxID=528191 RepID=UPI00164389F6|nr:MucR family transcriptional regulator [Paenibacillus xylanexedens]